MLFASIELAGRIERAECRLLTDCAEAVTRLRPEAAVFVEPLAGGVAVFTTPGSPLNKVAGLGFAGPVDEAELAGVEQQFDRRASPVHVELSCLAEPSIGALLTQRGYVLQGFENVLGRRLPVPAEVEPAPAIELTREPDMAQWIDVVVTAFSAPDEQGVPSHESFPRDELQRVMEDVAGADGVVRYLARRQGEAAGGASLKIFDGVGQLCGAATLPAHRRRGVQSALLAARLSEAARASCDVAVATTQPGSKSHENIQRQGFELLYTRAILVRPPPR